MNRILILAGDGGMSGVPRYVNDLYNAINQLDNYQILVASGKNLGGFDEITQKKKHIELRYVKSSDHIKIAFTIRYLITFVREHKINIIWANSTFSILIARIVCVFNKNIKLITTYHGVPFGQQGFLHSLIGRITELFTFIKRSDVDIVISRNDEKLLENCLRLSAKKKYVIFNTTYINAAARICSPVTRLSPTRVLTVGRLAKQKNLSSIFRLSNQLGKNYEFTIVGKDVTNLEEHSSQFRNANVNLIDEVKNLEELYASSQLYFCSSLYEGFSLAMLEALSFGLPIISTNVGGAFELQQHGANISIISSLSADCFNESIRSTLANDERLTNRNVFDIHFSPVAWQNKIHTVLNDLVAVDSWKNEI